VLNYIDEGLTNAVGLASLWHELIDVKQAVGDADDKMHRLEAILFRIVSLSPDTVAISTLREGRYIYVNPVWTIATGYTREETIGRTSVEIGFWIDPAERTPLREALEKYGQTDRLQIRFATKSGEVRYGLHSAALIRGFPEPCIAAIMTDITKFKNTQEALESSKVFADSLLNSSPNPTLIIESDTSLRYVNPAFEQLTGFFLSDVIGKKSPYPWFREETLVDTTKAYEASLGDPTCANEMLFRRKDGTEFWVKVNSKAIADGQAPPCFLSCWVDVSAERLLRENMSFYIKETISAQERERKRIALELHDDSIQALAALHMDMQRTIDSIQSELSTSKQRELRKLAVGVRNVTDGLRRLTHDLCSWPLDKLGLVAALELMTQEMTSRCGFKTQLKVVGIETRLNSEAKLSLFRICQEALNNICKHSEATRAAIRLSFLPRTVRLVVSDDGIGFDKPKQITDLVRDGKVGLAGMRERAQLLGGRLSVTSKLGKGTTIVVEIGV